MIYSINVIPLILFFIADLFFQVDFQGVFIFIFNLIVIVFHLIFFFIDQHVDLFFFSFNIHGSSGSADEGHQVAVKGCDPARRARAVQGDATH